MSELANAAWRYADSYAFMERTVAGLPPTMICVAVNGGIQGKESHDQLPETVDEIVESVQACQEAGASMVHVHCRDPESFTHGARRAEHWHVLVSLLRKHCPGIIINCTTGGDPGMSMEERLSCLDAAPDIASLNLTPDMSRFKLKARRAPLPHPRDELTIDTCIPFTYGQVEWFAGEMQRRGIKPELETYHTGGAWVVRELIRRGLITPPYLIQTVMGAQTASFPTVENVLQLLRELPEQTLWLCSGIGPFQLPMTTLATLMGGHVRVGLEDNLYFSRGRKFRDNAEAVSRAARLIGELNRDVATTAQARQMLGLAPALAGERA